MKKLSAAVLSAALILTACGSAPAPAANTTDTAPAETTTTTAASFAETTAQTTAASSAKAEDVEILNFIPPAEGEEIAVINIKDYGVIKIKLFPDTLPKAVENFKGLIGMNYYDGLTFHRIIPNFMIQGGDPRGTGMGGNSMWGGQFDGGTADGLCHFTGAVAYANSGSTATDGSQFYIVNTPDGYLQYTCEELMAIDPVTYNFPKNVCDMYTEKGGTPFLDGNYTVFGQVIEGMDVVRKVAAVETDPSNDMPLVPVTMESVRLEEYHAN